MKGHYFLKGISIQGDIVLSYSGSDISIAPINDNVLSLEKLKKQLEVVEETGSLKIITPERKDVNLKLALSLKNLLSFALGNQIVFDRAVFEENEVTEEVNKEMIKNENSGRQIIPELNIPLFLEETLPVWHELSKVEQDQYYIIIDYLNQSTCGFIEDRILRITQAWESLAWFLNVEAELPASLSTLRNELKSTYRTWRNKGRNKEVDPNGVLGNKITSAIDREKLLIRLDNLISEIGIDTEKINLDFSTLKSLRDQVAHTGSIEMKGNEAIGVLEPAIVGLQITLLKKLKYSGKIINIKNGTTAIENISDFDV